MSSDERALWLSAAWAEVSEIPAPAFLDACSHARRAIDHPAKLIPYIVRESEEYGRYLLGKLSQEESLWANQNAPRLPPAEPRPHVDPFAADRDEVSALMKDLIASLKGKAADPDG